MITRQSQLTAGRHGFRKNPWKFPKTIKTITSRFPEVIVLAQTENCGGPRKTPLITRTFSLA